LLKITLCEEHFEHQGSAAIIAPELEQILLAAIIAHKSDGAARHVKNQLEIQFKLKSPVPNSTFLVSRHPARLFCVT
jgi:hypothetical protein